MHAVLRDSVRSQPDTSPTGIDADATTLARRLNGRRASLRRLAIYKPRLTSYGSDADGSIQRRRTQARSKGAARARLPHLHPRRSAATGWHRSHCGAALVHRERGRRSQRRRRPVRETRGRAFKGSRYANRDGSDDDQRPRGLPGKRTGAISEDFSEEESEPNIRAGGPRLAGCQTRQWRTAMRSGSANKAFVTRYRLSAHGSSS